MQNGNRVRVVSANNRDLVGLTGTVVAMRKCGSSIGVEFDSYVNGHSCNGNAEDGYGLWLGLEQLTVEYCGTCPQQCNEVEKKEERSMLRKLSTFAKRHLDKDSASFVKIGWMTEGLEVTGEGERALSAFLFNQFKKELGDIAREEIEEIESSK